MNDIWWTLLVFLSQLASVLALVLNSKLLRDDRWQLAMINSWLISLTQFLFVWVTANTDNPMAIFFAAGLGGSLGCGAGHLIYTRFLCRKNSIWTSKPSYHMQKHSDKSK